MGNNAYGSTQDTHSGHVGPFNAEYSSGKQDCSQNCTQNDGETRGGGVNIGVASYHYSQTHTIDSQCPQSNSGTTNNSSNKK